LRPGAAAVEARYTVPCWLFRPAFSVAREARPSRVAVGFVSALFGPKLAFDAWAARIA
jgi:hypothetical protein